MSVIRRFWLNQSSEVSVRGSLFTLGAAGVYFLVFIGVASSV